jgi:hypothetical protein
MILIITGKTWEKEQIILSRYFLINASEFEIYFPFLFTIISPGIFPLQDICFDPGLLLFNRRKKSHYSIPFNY